jgi:hypothetical protein
LVLGDIGFVHGKTRRTEEARFLLSRLHAPQTSMMWNPEVDRETREILSWVSSASGRTRVAEHPGELDAEQSAAPRQRLSAQLR